MESRKRLFCLALTACALAFVSSTTLAVPVSQWDLDEPSGTTGVGSVVDSISGINGTPTGTVGFGAIGASPNTGTSASLAGAGHIEVGYTPAENPTSFTVTAWAKVTPGSASAGYRSVITSRNDPGSNLPAPGVQGYIIYANPSNNWEFWTGAGGAPGTWNVLGGGAVADGAWTHLAISYDAGSSTKSFYINGNLAASTALQGYVPNTAEGLHVGGGGDTGTSFRFRGQIDDVRTFSTALTADQVKAIGFGGPSQNVSACKSYADSVLPTFSGGTFYLDNAHAQATGVFDTGDLTDGVTFPTAAPTSPVVNTVVGWGDPASVSTAITFDLENNYAIDMVRIGAHTWAPFANGAPDDVLITFSQDGVVFGDPVFQTFAAPPGNGHWDLDVLLSDYVVARYVRLSFDGGAVLTGNTPNKWLLDEVTIFGSPIPEPASMSLLLLAAAGMMRRQRRAA